MAAGTVTEVRARGGRFTRSAGLAIAFGLLAFAALLSLGVGARSIPLGEVVDALVQEGSSQNEAIIRNLRVPRTLLGIAVGGAIGVAGALMQALTRNPLADPGLLGVNAGASAAVVIALSLGLAGATSSVWFAFLGAAAASVAVYAIGTAGRGGATPVRLALAGTAIAAALTALIYGVAMTDQKLLQQYNFWSVGALGGRGRSQLEAVIWFIAIGMLLALALARSLNALAMGDDSARALGAKVGRTRIGGAISVTLLCGAATAAAGPMYFLGLTVPHAARALCGPDQRWVLAYSAVLGAALILVADVIGRVVVRPSELPAGVMMAVIGTPLFIALVRRKRIAQL
ncbi:iron chelate uptake ABC transporter family permease subunit [Solirubrobacter sp. CPCC 204708]|uniref:Iron chelate uptake ABC transporter family permease subunit n=1 Tax=Solirubrobacter deserti TaxID=2282478 RepID=A0ABT4RV02_9ACTN|nr:iron chelate uptake ABC transporter family permease subunit [Solirubrobacter deserti]MBE2318902.1 iron chelate uptake ABC transporter family permease subunit [Solirubrobacter deserti]MDA0142406.1 iron chelate uptake ABC transporter family permease subunit [Solirubrobacter deserti]